MTAPGKDAPGPGDQLPGESAKAFHAFRLYLEAGPRRSTAAVGEELGHRSSKQAEKWSAKFSWVERVQAYEAEAVDVRDEAHKMAIAQRSARQAEIAHLHGEATLVVADEILERLARHQRKVKAGELDEDATFLQDLTLEQLIQLEGTVARAHARVVVTERLALGITTDQPGEPLPRAEAEERASRATDEELDEVLAPIDQVAEQRAKRDAAA